jgi:hypothetical protein
MIMRNSSTSGGKYSLRLKRRAIFLPPGTDSDTVITKLAEVDLRDSPTYILSG